MKLPRPTSPEPPPDRAMMKLAPRFAEKVFALIHDLEHIGHDPLMFEGFRSDERAAWLYQCGRTFDDGRGIVTNAPNAAKTWHRYGLGADIISKSKQWDAPDQFWMDLRDSAASLGLTAGATWTRPDRPHVQWWCKGMHVTPSDHAWELLQSKGVEAVWRELHADDWPPLANERPE